MPNGKSISAALACLGIVLGTLTVIETADAAPKKRAAAEHAACATLREEYENSSKRLALYSAQGAIGGPAAAAQANQRSANAMSEANTTLSLMRGHGCKLPNFAPNPDRYRMQGLRCISDMIGAMGRPPSCIIENWKPE